MPDRVIQAGETFIFPPPGPRGTLRLKTPGEETFIAMCNASPEAIREAKRDTRSVTCSGQGPSDEANSRLLEVATHDPNEDARDAHTARAASAIPKQTILQATVVARVVD